MRACRPRRLKEIANKKVLFTIYFSVLLKYSKTMPATPLDDHFFVELRVRILFANKKKSKNTLAPVEYPLFSNLVQV
jgi:hypothetical protein